MQNSKTVYGIFVSVFCLAIILNCGGGSGETTSNEPGENSVTTTVAAEGGTLSHPSGFTAEFAEDCVSDPTKISIEETSSTSPLPPGITLSSKVFRVTSESTTFNKPVLISFSLSDMTLPSDESLLGIFRWDGSQWYSLGTFIDGINLYAFTPEFSSFAVGTANKEWKKFVFLNMGTEGANLIIENSTVQSPPSINVHVPGAPYDYITPEALLPQGCYSFCYDFSYHDQHAFEWVTVHNFEGNNTDPWDYCLSDADSNVAPPFVWIDTTYAYYNGPCQGGGGNGSNQPEWHSARSCEEDEGSNYEWRWVVSLIKTGDSVEGNLYFHYCPGGGRAHYQVKGRETAANTFEVSGNKVSGRGNLGDTTPVTKDFTLKLNESPQPNYAP